VSITDPAELFALMVDDAMPWQHYALCGEVGGDIFFPAQCEPAEPAKRICRACEVREPCLEYALDHEGLKGVWGGMSERERRRFKRQQREKRAA
jgi:WhiB family transcriptional regulator, redox-sensing transcriptional regulator